MASALELGLLLNDCGIYTIDGLVRHLRASPAALAELLDSERTKALLAVTL